MSEEIHYDCIIIAEVLEHLLEPELFIEKSSRLLSENGVLIVTVPFAINDYPDHKRTYYFSLLYQQISKYIPVVDYEILGNWIGVVASKKCENLNISEEVLGDIEKGFYQIERELRDKIDAKNKRIEKLVADRDILRDKIKAKDERIEKLVADRDILRDKKKKTI